MAESQRPYENPPPYSPPEQGHGQGSEKVHGGGGENTDEKPLLYHEAPPAYYDGAQNFGAQNFSPINAPVNPAFTGTNVPNYGSTVFIHQPPMTTTTTTQVIIVGGCPACRVGVLEDDFTCLGICMALFCFPIGILCCLAMRQRHCPNCGAMFG